MNNQEIRSSTVIRRLSYVSLLKIFFLGGVGLIVPFCALCVLTAMISPSSVHLQEGQTMTQFLLVLAALIVVWPLIFALFFGTAAWLALGVKSLVSPTSIELVIDESDLPLKEPSVPTRGNVT